MTEAECTAAGKTWQATVTANATAGTDLCAEGTPVIMGCYSYSGRSYSCDCSMGNEYVKSCAKKDYSYRGSRTPAVWQQCKDFSGTDCDILPSADLLAARAAPGPPSLPPLPPSPPSTPPAPPQKCIPQVHSRRNPFALML
jgi:hypothetical protein